MTKLTKKLNIEVGSINDARKAYEALSEVGLIYHPDDSIDDIIWSRQLSDQEFAALKALDGKLWDFFSTSPEYDIYEEVMEADIRVHGKASCFYNEEDEE